MDLNDKITTPEQFANVLMKTDCDGWTMHFADFLEYAEIVTPSNLDHDFNVTDEIMILRQLLDAVAWRFSDGRSADLSTDSIANTGHDTAFVNYFIDYWAQFREYLRFYFGNYTAINIRFPDSVDIARREQVRERMLPHYLHNSLTASNKVAVTLENPHFEQDRQTIMKFGRFLNRTCNDILSPNEIRDITTMTMGQYEYSFHWAETEDDIIWVYENGPESCMGKEADEFDSSVHPVAAYDSPDIAIAYVTDGNNRVIARTCCNVNDKQYNRIFGEKSVIAPFLNDAGYTVNIDALIGCRLKPIEDDDGFVGPYVDCYDDNNIYEIGDWLYIGNHYAESSNAKYAGRTWASYDTGGYLMRVEKVPCASCGMEVVTNNMHRTFHGLVCDDCWENHVIRYEEDVGQEFVIRELCVQTVDGRLFPNGTFARANGYGLCRHNDRFYPESELVRVHSTMNIYRLHKDCTELINELVKPVDEDRYYTELAAEEFLYQLPDGRYLNFLGDLEKYGYEVIDGQFVAIEEESSNDQANNAA